MHRFAPVKAPEPSEHDYHVMVKPISGVCNLRCTYCYYLPVVDMYRSRPDCSGSFRMSDQTLERFTSQYLARPIKDVQFAWQGGEPTLMGLDFFRKAVELQQKYRREGQSVQNSLQTNGVLLDDEWCNFFREKGFLIGLSIDGPAPYHDRYRRDAAGAATFDRVSRGLRLLKKHRVEFNALVVISQANVHDPEGVYRFLVNQGVRYIQFIPLLEYDKSTLQPHEYSITGRQYGEFLNTVFDLWFERHISTVFVQIIEQALAAHLGLSPTLCVHMPTCGRALILEHNGDLYACDHFPFPDYLRGNIHSTALSEMVNSPEQVRFGLSKRDDLPESCRECPYLPACNGGCLKHRIVEVPGQDVRLNWFCEGYKMFFGHSFERLAAIAKALRAGQPARAAREQFASGAGHPTIGSDLRPSPAAAGTAGRLHRAGRAKPRRNDPCPCGSGLKYKHCCGRKA